jgi:vitamin B12 transporter
MISEYHEFGMFPYSSVLPELKNNIYGIYLQDQFKYQNRFFITPGIRYDHNDIFGSKVTYRVAPAYFISSSGTKIKGTYGTGFKSPSLFYLFDPVYGNKDLKPEESTGWDIGVEQYFYNAGVMAGVTFFRMDFSEMFGFDPMTFKTVNIYKASSEGVELYMTAEPVRDLRIKSNYTFTQVKDKSDGSGSSVLFRRPKHKAVFTADYNFAGNAGAGVELIYTGERSDNYYPDFFSPAQRVTLTVYTLLNVTASYRVWNKIVVYTRLENILNEKYEEIYGFGVPGFSVFGGVKIDTGNLIN